MLNKSITILTMAALAISACDAEEASTPASPSLEGALAKGGAAAFRTTAPAQAELLTAGHLIPLATAGDIMPGSGERLGRNPRRDRNVRKRTLCPVLHES